MTFDVNDQEGLVFLFGDLTLTRNEVKSLLQVCIDLVETNDYEFPYVVPTLISRASFILKKSSK